MRNGMASLDADLFAEFASKAVSLLPRTLDASYVQELVEKPSLLGALLGRAFAPALGATLPAEQIMQRLQKLYIGACVRMRENFLPGRSKWYVDVGPVVLGWLARSGWAMLDVHKTSGASPEEALANTWNYILAESEKSDRFFLFYNCQPKENIPGDGPQVWVKWSEAKGNWEDVAASPKALAAHNIPSDRIRPFSDHGWRQRL